ncbi:MAG TPA: MarR family transcriptional regulator [Alphaproteobacteria bacterium]|nr:MarR family transcriptional regulator [Alphaproteobacteria bacterium]
MPDDPGALLWRAANDWQRAAHAALSPLKLTYAQGLLLTALADRTLANGATIQVELARLVRADAMMTSQILRILERRRLVARATVANDARARHVRLTAEGESVAARARAVLGEAIDAFFAPLGPQRGAFAAALGQLIGVRVRLRVPSATAATGHDRASRGGNAESR